MKSKRNLLIMLSLSAIIFLLSTVPAVMEMEGGASKSLPPMSPPPGGIPDLPDGVTMYDIQELMGKVQAEGELTQDLKKEAEAMGLPSDMVGMMERGSPSGPRGLNPIIITVMIGSASMFLFSSYRLYQIRR
ncbi:hypothetical protein B4U37_01795 [Sutcliffiella horikoshii]|uniref:Uncharacterized protein n=1 Tax=Sutcliffiella horikoshii TaxID=79883 RepID=A0ABM6KEJ9_9BACI|nr:hypothetical protein [Sutcliffiella horikoshii]ART74857.1 hypothetical protein B4U37_01795 [Sutcliffiella horikoshii]